MTTPSGIRLKKSHALALLVLACTFPQSAAAIIGGIPTSDFPTVSLFVSFTLDEQNQERALPCSAVEVGPGTLLTSAHCTDFLKQVLSREVHSEHHMPAKIQKILVHPEYRQNGRHQIESDSDLAVVLFEPQAVISPLGAANYHYPRIASRPPKRGSLVELVGYGGIRPGRIKLIGTNTVAEVANGCIWLLGRLDHSEKSARALGVRFPGDLATVEAGDSGGPLFDESGVVLGIASKISGARSLVSRALTLLFFNIPFPRGTSIYTDLTTEKSRRFLDYARTQGARFNTAP